MLEDGWYWQGLSYSVSVASKWVWGIPWGRERFWAGSRHFQTHTLPCASCVHHHRLRAAAHWACKTTRVGSPWTPGWKTGWNTDKILGNRCYQMHVPVPDAVWNQTNWSITDWIKGRCIVGPCKEKGDSSPCSKPQTPQRVSVKHF